MTTKLSRRTFIRGAGAAIALPWLESIRPLKALAEATSSAAAAAAPPVRMAFMYFPNGAWPKAWVPEKSGADYELPFSLTPLDKLKNEVVVLSGLDKAA